MGESNFAGAPESGARSSPRGLLQTARVAHCFETPRDQRHYTGTASRQGEKTRVIETAEESGWNSHATKLMSCTREMSILPLSLVRLGYGRLPSIARDLPQ